jgi:Flp pilus assembly protein TadD
MSPSLPDDLILLFNRHYEKGWSLLQAVVILEGPAILKPNFWQRWKGRHAINHFQRCLELVPEHWQTHWALGKAYQGLGEHATALASFAEAVRLQPQHPDVLREASIAAMDAGQPDLAAQYSDAALSINPDDAGLMCNHAINLLVTGDDLGATELIAKALTIAPDDPINQHASQLIRAVASGLKKRPTWQTIN